MRSNTVELVTAGAWHDSLGDLALQEATQIELAKRGIPSIPVCPPSGTRLCVIGGGAILSRQAAGPFGHALAPFRAPGPHVLNSAAVVDSGDYSYLAEYSYVAVRDRQSLSRISGQCPNPQLAPCPSVLLQRPDMAYLRGLPSYGWLDRTMNRGEYVVVDAGLSKRESLGIPDGLQSLIVNTRPWNSEVKPAFPHRNPTALLAAIAGAKAVLASSLHLGILAMAMDVPFAVLGGTGGKEYGYWDRASFTDCVWSREESLFSRAVEIADLMRIVRESEIYKAGKHMDDICEALRSQMDV